MVVRGAGNPITPRRSSSLSAVRPDGGSARSVWSGPVSASPSLVAAGPGRNRISSQHPRTPCRPRGWFERAPNVSFWAIWGLDPFTATARGPGGLEGPDAPRVSPPARELGSGGPCRRYSAPPRTYGLGDSDDTAHPRARSRSGWRRQAGPGLAAPWGPRATTRPSRPTSRAAIRRAAS